MPHILSWVNFFPIPEKTPEEIRDYMNRYLPDDICVQEAKLAADRFHARYRAVGKLYTYTCYVGDTKPVFNRNTSPCSIISPILPPCSARRNISPASMITKASVRTRR